MCEPNVYALEPLNRLKARVLPGGGAHGGWKGQFGGFAPPQTTSTTATTTTTNHDDDENCSRRQQQQQQLLLLLLRRLLLVCHRRCRCGYGYGYDDDGYYYSSCMKRGARSSPQKIGQIWLTRKQQLHKLVDIVRLPRLVSS